MATRKETRSIADFVTDVAYRKRRAAQARFAGAAPGQEAPRDVYLAACASIGAHLGESFGFKYTKSNRRARKRFGDFTFQISFHSSNNNIAGEHVHLCIYGNVLSSKIKKWREAQPLIYSTDYVAGGQIGNLQQDHSWLTWELANPHKRNETICDAIKAIEELAFPYFAKFEELSSLFQLLVSEDLPEMTADRVVEFLMCFADQLTARRAAANSLDRRPNLVRAYQRDYSRYAERGLGSTHPSGFAKQMAFASHVFKFGDLTACQQ